MSSAQPGPSSRVMTFLFTDIEGSTELAGRSGSSFAASLSIHDKVLRDAIDRHAGPVQSTAGDSFFAVFDDAIAALDTALGVQLGLQEATWPSEP